MALSHLEREYPELKKRGIELVSIMPDSMDMLVRYTKANNLRSRILLDRPETDSLYIGPIATKFKSGKRLFLIGSDGRIAANFPEGLPMRWIHEELAKLGVMQ